MGQEHEHSGGSHGGSAAGPVTSPEARLSLIVIEHVVKREGGALSSSEVAFIKREEAIYKVESSGRARQLEGGVEHGRWSATDVALSLPAGATYSAIWVEAGAVEHGLETSRVAHALEEREASQTFSPQNAASHTLPVGSRLEEEREDTQVHFSPEHTFMHVNLPDCDFAYGKFTAKIECFLSGQLTIHTGPHESGEPPPPPHTEGHWDVDFTWESEHHQATDEEHEGPRVGIAIGRAWEMGRESWFRTGWMRITEASWHFHPTLRTSPVELDLAIEGEIVLADHTTLQCAFHFVKAGNDAEGEAELSGGSLEVSYEFPPMRLLRLPELGPAYELHDVEVSAKVNMEFQPHWSAIWDVVRPMITRQGRALARGAVRVFQFIGFDGAIAIGVVANGIFTIAASWLELRAGDEAVRDMPNARNAWLDAIVYGYRWGVENRQMPGGETAEFARARELGHEAGVQDYAQFRDRVVQYFRDPAHLDALNRDLQSRGEDPVPSINENDAELLIQEDFEANRQTFESRLRDQLRRPVSLQIWDAWAPRLNYNQHFNGFVALFGVGPDSDPELQAAYDRHHH